MNTKTKILSLVIWILVGCCKLYAQIPARKLIDKVIASIDDQPILKSEVEAEYERYQQQLGAEKGPTKCEILENMIINNIILANAAKKGIHIKNEEIDRYLNYQMEGILREMGSEARLEQYVNQVLGKSLKNFKKELRKNIKNQLTIEKMRNVIIGDITISPSEVKTFFNQLNPNDIPFYPATVEAYQLVVYPPLDQEQKRLTIEKLETLKARIQVGEDFAVLAKQYSEDTGSAINGGEIGFWRIGELDSVYEKAALALKPGEISSPIETKFGFHIIQLIERQKSKYNTRHILLTPTVSAPNLQEAVTKLTHIRADILENKITFEKAIATYSEDIDTAKRGALLTRSDEGARMLVDKLPPDLFFILDKMSPGSISEPITFTTSQGKQAARIIYLKEKIPSHKANLEQDYERISKLALNAKKQEALDEWIKTAKSQAFIELDPEFEVCKIGN
jgi:peptidyl-prolyl cis-trans isomerase SurA